MPVVRYFLFVGGALIALLLFADWVWSGSTPVQQAATEAPANDVILRIRSGQKWPEKVVFDTTMPTIVPPSPPPVAIAASTPSATDAQKADDQKVAAPLEAHAEMKPAARRLSPPRRQARVHHHRGPQQGPTWVAANPPGWSWNW